MKVLIIDDEPIVRRSLERAAVAHGHTVLLAADGDEGLAIWQKENPDLVYLDVLMPKLNGPQVIQKVGPTAATIVLMSAYTGEYNFERAKEVGANLFLAKPFENIFEVIKRGVELAEKKVRHG